MFSFSQNSSNQEKIKSNLEDYFHFERENIHVQFNKTLYVSNENIAFKGYVFNKQNNLPNLNTTNVQLVVYDPNGLVIQKQLLHAAFGTFEGIVTLDKKIVSGKYYFHFYTNWMNNFMEDESFVQTIEVINQNDPYNLKTNQPNLSNVSISFNPESGVFINGIRNTVGIQIKDCNELGIQIIEGFVLDSKGKIVTTFFTNKMGYGKFELTPVSNEIYIMKIAIDNLKMQKQLPQPQNSGIIITYNNNLLNNILEVTVKTNLDGVNLYHNKNYTLLIHQNGKNIQKEFNFDDKNPIQILTFDKNDLSNGVNSIRIIDENLNEIGERLLYLNKEAKEIPLLETQLTTNDSIELLGKLNTKGANLSISVLPINTACNDHKNSILGTFYLNAYLEKPVLNNYSYFDFENVTRAFDLELLMLNQEKSKYHWNNIMTNKPKEFFKFSKGITINGTIVKTLNPKTKYKVALISLKNNLFEEAIVDKNNKFSFENFYARDSTAYQLKLMDDSNLPIETKMITNILFKNEPFLKKLNFESSQCSAIKDLKNTYTFNDLELDKKTITLPEINIKNIIYSHQNESDNSFLKPSIGNENYYWKILNLLGNYSINNGINEGFLDDFSNFNNPNTTYSNYARKDSRLIYVDGIQISDSRDLFSIDPKDVGGIYTDRMGAPNSSTGGFGTINIYLKKGRNTGFFPKKHNTIIINNGFAKTKIYETTNFYKSKEFDFFGTMQWFPNVFLDADQFFEVKFAKANQKEIQVFIEGFTIDGQLISEVKKISVAKKI
jgi:hypothetical protein